MGYRRYPLEFSAFPDVSFGKENKSTPDLATLTNSRRRRRRGTALGNGVGLLLLQ